jgi:hypothetical protein
MTEREAVRLVLACLADPGDAVCRLALADACEELGRDASCLRADGRWGVEWGADRHGRKSHWLFWRLTFVGGHRGPVRWVAPLSRRQLPRRRCPRPPCRPLELTASARTGWAWRCAVCHTPCDAPFAPPPPAR